MKHVLPFDIETRSTVELPDVGAHIYATHPDTEVRCLAYCVDDGPVKIWHPGDPVPGEFLLAANLRKDDWRGVTHNVPFDHKILTHKLAPLFGFPIIPIERMVCTMAMCHASALPGKLERAAKVLNLENQKDGTGARTQMQMARPRRARKGEDKSGVYFFEDPEKHALSDNSCMTDVKACRELFQILPELSDDEMQTWLLDQRINDYGFYLDRPLAEAARKIALAANPVINDELTKITDGEVTAFTQVKRLAKWIGQYIDIDSLNKVAIEELFEMELPKDVRRVLELRLLGAQAAVAKVDALLQRRCDDGRIRGSFVYHAAGPGRWSSRGVQVQNLKRPLTEDLNKAVKIIGTGDLKIAKREYANPLSVIGDCIRGMIVAAPGHVLVGGDFSGIEARVTAWIAGEIRKLDVFRAYDAGTGPDPYIVAAAIIFKLDVNKLAADYKAGKPEAREYRQVGKGSELAFGFQGGVNAYKRFLPAGTVALTETESFHQKMHGHDRGSSTVSAEIVNSVSDLEIERIKNAWRRAHPNIVRFWDNINRAAWQAVRNEDSVVSLGNNLQLTCDDQPIMKITLPSGHDISYPNMRMVRGYNFDGKLIEHPNGFPMLWFKDAASGQWRDVKVYGGLLTENIVQGIARDLLRDAMLRIDAAGYKIVLHVHDEIVIEVPKILAKKAEREFSRLMSIVPEWAEGLPIKVNTWTGHRYAK